MSVMVAWFWDMPGLRSLRTPNEVRTCNQAATVSYQVSTTFNSSPYSAAYMRRWTGSPLVQVMACRLLGAKPLPEPMNTYFRLDA